MSSYKEYELSENINSIPLIELKTEDIELNDLVKDEKEVKEEKKLLVYELKKVSIFRIIWHLSKKLEIFFMIAGTFCTFFSGCSNALWNILAGNTINKLTNIIGLDDLPEEEYHLKILEIESPVNHLIMLFMVLGAVTFITNFFMLSLWGYSALRQMNTLKIKYFQLVLNQEQSWFDENNSFEFSTKIQSQLEQIELGLGDRFSQIILMIADILAGFIVGFMTSWKLTLIICSSFPIIAISVFISDNFSEKLVIKTKELNEKAGGIAEELLYNIKTVASFCNFDFEINRYNEIITEISKYEQKRLLIEGLSYGLLYTASFASVGFSVLMARNMVYKEYNPLTKSDYNGGDILTVVMSVINVIYSVSGLAPNFEIIQKACVASSDYFTLLSRHKKKPITNGGYRPPREEFQGRIEFKNVYFSYPHDKSKKLVLDDLNLVIEPGKKIAIVGESGCGKSTTISLIERFYDINSGEILIDGVDIKKYDINYLRDLIGYVQQEPVLFNFSIKDNLIFGRQKKLEKLGEVGPMIVDSCEEAQIKNFIERNPERYNYVVGIKGSKLSGGQKQRLAIARAILMKPKILILDEATSALDNRAEKKVQYALDNISKKDITTIVIAHRLSTIKNADLIYVMKKGKIIEKGTHRELRDLNGFYTSLIRDQLAADEIRNLNERLKNKNIDTNVSVYMSAIVDTFDEENLDESELISVSQTMNEDEEVKEKKIKIERKKLWDLVTDHKCDLSIGIISSLLFGAVCPLVGLIIGKTINFLSLRDDEKRKSEGLKYAFIYIGISIFGGLTLFIKTWKLQGLGAIISMKIKKRVLEKYLELDMGYFDKEKNSPGALSTKLSIDSSELDSIILEFVGGISTIASTFLISIILGVVYDWKTTLILMAFMPVIVFGIIKKDDYKENGRESNKAIKIEAGSFLSESVVNIKTIFSFNFQAKALELYENILQSEKKSFLKDAILQGLWLGLGLSAFNFAFGIAFKCGFIFLEKRTVTFDNLMSSINILMNTCDGLSDVLRNMGNTAKAKLAYQSVFETLDAKIEFSPFKDKNNLKISAKNIEGNIEFKNVTFSYPTKPDQLILKNLSLSIKAGQRVGLVGLSGSGKSSIIQLIERFYDVNSGEILIDGRNIQDYNLYELRKKIGLVSQEPSIFKRNIYQNILYGDLSAKKENVLEMAQKAHINYLLKRDNTENDTPLSGGEKQRVAIARAFLKEPSIILLDEATSAMDIETENEVVKNIYENLNENKTCINVSHRLSSIINSDIIFVLDQGQLVERGTHEELTKIKGKYYTLYKYSRK